MLIFPVPASPPSNPPYEVSRNDSANVRVESFVSILNVRSETVVIISS